MTELIPDSDAVASEIRAMRATGAMPRGLSCSRHPDPAARAYVVTSMTSDADRVLRDLAKRYGRRFWDRGRWRTVRVQLALPGIG